MQPNDLMPLPTMPYPERPDSLPLDVEECRTALWMHNGNVTEAAKTLKVSSSRLRSFIKSSAYLSAEAAEAREQLVDKAEDVVREALNDPDRADAMARFVLSSLGKTRGYNQNSATGAKSINIGNMTIVWGDEPAPNVIEGTAAEVS